LLTLVVQQQMTPRWALALGPLHYFPWAALHRDAVNEAVWMLD